jgi:hypothetical protein
LLFIDWIIRQPWRKINRPEQRFGADETDERRNADKMRQPLMGFVLAFNGRSDPDILIPVAPIRWEHLADVLRALCQQLPIQCWRLFDHGPKIASPFRFSLIVEHVRQRRAEYFAALACRSRFTVPLDRLFPVCR